MIDLKTETQDLHSKVEDCYYPKQLFCGNITLDEYVTYLKIFYRLHHSIESDFKKFKDQWIKYDFPYEKYYRLSLLQKDLANLSYVTIEKPSLENFSINSFPEAIGFLYVLTGSTMGGMLLAAKVENNNELNKYKAINNYFLGFKEKTYPMWGDFIKFINLYTQINPDIEKSIIKGARDCFELIIKEIDDEK